MKLLRLFSLSIASLCSVLAACGSDDDDGGLSACGTWGACGGDVLGTWTVTEACLVTLDQPMLEFCSMAKADAKVKVASGQFIFDKDTFASQVELEIEGTLQFPASCKVQDGSEFECSDFNDVTDDGEVIRCSDSGTGCECKWPVNAPSMGDGIYTARNNQLELGAAKSDYCIQGDRLAIRPTMSMDMGSMGAGKTRLQLLLAKKK